VRIGERELLVVGDRVLVRPEEGESTTGAGLILPASVADREAVQAGRIVALGPGIAMPPNGFSWTDDGDADGPPSRAEPRYVAMQGRVGDVAVFFRKSAVEITVDSERFVVVPHGAILVLLRDAHGQSPMGVA
jgi:co-chaperonin GroES (HSP10)